MLQSGTTYFAARNSLPDTCIAVPVEKIGENLTDHPIVSIDGKVEYGPGVGGVLGTSGVTNGPLPPSQLPAGQSPVSPHTLTMLGNVGNGRASQFQIDMNVVWIIGTPPTVSLFPSVTQYS